MALAYKNAGAWGGASGAGTAGRLTSLQGDNNIYELSQQIAAIVAAATAIGLDPDGPVTISGDQLTFHFSDSSETTITLPTAMPVWRGEFSTVSYAEGDWFSESGTIYRVLVAHTGELPFDPGAILTSDGNLYAKIMDTLAVWGREVSDATFTPALTDANRWIVLTNSSGGCAVSIDPAIAFSDWTAIFIRDETRDGATFEAVTGATINSQYNCLDQSAGPGSTITLKKRGATDAWDIFGLLALDVTA